MIERITKRVSIICKGGDPFILTLHSIVEFRVQCNIKSMFDAKKEASSCNRTAQHKIGQRYRYAPFELIIGYNYFRFGYCTIEWMFFCC